MSNELVNNMRSIRLPPIYKTVLWVLCDIASDKGDTHSYAPLSRLIDETCLSRDSVIRALAWLESVNLISANRGNGRLTTYKITLENANLEAIESEVSRKKIAGTRQIKSSKPVDHSNQSTTSTSRPQLEIPVDHSVQPVDHSVQPVDAAYTNHLFPIIHQEQPSINAREVQLKKPDQVSEQVWKDFTKLRKTKKAPLTQTALNGIIREANLAGWTLEAALTECLERGWQGFKAEWVRKTHSKIVQREKSAIAKNQDAWDEYYAQQALEERIIDVTPHFGAIDHV